MAADSKNKDGVQLERHVSLMSGIALIVGTMIGSGIFISPKGMLEGCGSVGLTLILWVVCGLLATMGALVYAELGTAVPKSGGEHAYLLYAFNRSGKRGALDRLPGFLYDWMGLLIIRPTMFAVMALALGTYVVKPFFPGCEPPVILVKLVTAVAMCIIAFVNCYSVKAATRVQNICTFTKVVALGIIAVGGIVKLFQGNTDSFEDLFGDTTSNFGTVAIAFYNGLWAFDGWNSLNFVTEELKNPSRNLPLAIMIGIPFTTLCYVLANVGYLAVMSKAEIMASHAVAVTWGDRMLGVMSWLIPVFVVVSTFGSSNGCLFSSGRLAYVAGRDGHFPNILGYISYKRLTPIPAMMSTLVVALCFIIPGDIGTLIDFFSFASWLFYGWSSFSLLYLRYKEPKLTRPYRVPIFVPVIVLLASIYLLFAPVIQNTGGNSFYALVFLAVGVFIFVPLVRMNLKPPGMDTVTIFLQKLLFLVPSD